MTQKYENIPLPSAMVQALDVLVAKFEYTSRPELLKELIRRHIERLVELKLLMPDEVRPFFLK
jgi:metal-responsive CopG/Arc/MetJ family transcriptional regulator